MLEKYLCSRVSSFCNYFLHLVNPSFLRRCHITFMNQFADFYFILFLNYILSNKRFQITNIGVYKSGTYKSPLFLCNFPMDDKNN